MKVLLRVLLSPWGRAVYGTGGVGSASMKVLVYAVALGFGCGGVVHMREGDTYQQLLEHRIANGREFSRVFAQAQVDEAEHNEVRTKTAGSVQIGTGGVLFNKKNGSGANGYKVEMAPHLSIASPFIGNSRLNLVAPRKLDGVTSTSTVSVDYTTDFYSSVRPTYLNSLKEKTYQKEKSGSALRDVRRLVEREFLQEVQRLYGGYADQVRASLELVRARLRFESVKRQGYQEDSAYFQSAQLAQVRAARARAQARQRFDLEYTRFAARNGVAYEDDERDGFLHDLAVAVPLEPAMAVTQCAGERGREYCDAQDRCERAIAQRGTDYSPFRTSARVYFTDGEENKQLVSGVAAAPAAGASTSTYGGTFNMAFPGGDSSFTVQNSKGAVGILANFEWSPIRTRYRSLDYTAERAERVFDEVELQAKGDRSNKLFGAIDAQGDSVLVLRGVDLQTLDNARKKARLQKERLERGIIGRLEYEAARSEYLLALASVAEAKARAIIFNTDLACAYGVGADAAAAQLTQEEIVVSEKKDAEEKKEESS
ncbi:hypothetical protein [Treponema paraluiscuniculi]|uniref:hypothetical protein n=1 Tax=Treponema paraluiscuniculi TaxID=53435 RepID=UPI0018722610|nr:hypothetical protein [Treponema paraluiscuniculi]